jgi:hypothetical protein
LGGGAAEVEDIPVAEAEFFRTLGRVETMRRLVESDPRLIHHYPFEGLGQTVKWADLSGDLSLARAVMDAGAGGLDVYDSAPGLDDSTSALWTFRSQENGNRKGVGLQSRTSFQPPSKFTVELLLLVESATAPFDTLRASAVSFQALPAGAGAMGVAVDRDRLVFRIGQNTPNGQQLVPGRWYYVAATFESGNGQTTVNAYLANLDEGDGRLEQVADNFVLKGAPAAGPLGIGKGYDGKGASAYPWAGRLDEIAIYGAILDRGTLDKHLEALLSKP